MGKCVGTKTRGFASMTDEERRKATSKGGRKAHQTGRAHEWTPAEARRAGKKSGESRRKKAKTKS